MLKAQLINNQGQMVAQTESVGMGGLGVEFVLGAFTAPADNVNDLMQHLITKAIHGEGDTDCHLLTLFAMTMQLKAKNILELGVREGVSTLPLLLAAHHTKGHVHSVDFFANAFAPPEFLKDSWTFHKAHTFQFLQNLPADYIFDIVFLDDWHAYEHVKTEIQLLAPHVNRTSLILMHDCMTNTLPNYHTVKDLDPGMLNYAGGGPGSAVQELDRSTWEFSTVPSCNGFTILRKLVD